MVGWLVGWLVGFLLWPHSVRVCCVLITVLWSTSLPTRPYILIEEVLHMYSVEFLPLSLIPQMGEADNYENPVRQGGRSGKPEMVYVQY